MAPEFLHRRDGNPPSSGRPASKGEQVRTSRRAVSLAVARDHDRPRISHKNRITRQAGSSAELGKNLRQGVVAFVGGFGVVQAVAFEADCG